MCYPVSGIMHIKEPLLLIGKSSPCGGSGFPFSLSTQFNNRLYQRRMSVKIRNPEGLANVCLFYYYYF